MNNVDELKKAMQDISSKKHVLSSDTVHTQETLTEQREQQRESATFVLEKQSILMREFRGSIALLMNIFKQSKFDQIMSFAVDPFRAVLLNFIIGLFRGFGFVLALVIVVYIFVQVFPELLFGLL